MTTKELKEIVNIYQEKLGLTHWRVTVKVMKPQQNPNNDAGMTYWFCEAGEAQIYIAANEMDPEHTIAHELCHLLLEGHMFAPRKYDRMYERGLNKLAEVIIGRRSRTKTDFELEPVAKRK